uniref:Nuclease associated modular domain-containing protein n=1 Tax=Salix viminalis TaxID=40686 RepID=A0A6N2K5M3_SALVM
MTMQIKMKLASLGHAQSKETRVKIGHGVRLGWQKRREKLMMQEGCYFEWQNLIAEASRRGYTGEGELQWDSYNILRQQLEFEWVQSVEKRKTTPRPKGSKRAPKSLEQRRKISEAIAAKWADPSLLWHF